MPQLFSVKTAVDPVADDAVDADVVDIRMRKKMRNMNDEERNQRSNLS